MAEKATPATLKTLIVRGLLVAAPFVLWTAYLWSLRFSTDLAGARNFDWPAMAYFGKWRVAVQSIELEGWETYARFSVLGLVGLTTQAIVLDVAASMAEPVVAVGNGLHVLMLVIGPAVWEGHPGAIARIVIPMTVAFNVLLPRTRWFLPLWILGNLGVFYGFEVMSLPWLSEW